jgi:hypothetical protein
MQDFDGAAVDFNYLELEGDYDLFGDGSIRILTTPGHTLGHQSIVVKTAAGNTYVVTWRCDLDAGEPGRLSGGPELQRQGLQQFDQPAKNGAATWKTPT